MRHQKKAVVKKEETDMAEQETKIPAQEET